MIPIYFPLHENCFDILFLLILSNYYTSTSICAELLSNTTLIYVIN